MQDHTGIDSNRDASVAQEACKCGRCGCAMAPSETCVNCAVCREKDRQRQAKKRKLTFSASSRGNVSNNNTNAHNNNAFNIQSSSTTVAAANEASLKHSNAMLLSSLTVDTNTMTERDSERKAVIVRDLVNQTEREEIVETTSERRERSTQLKYTEEITMAVTEIVTRHSVVLIEATVQCSHAMTLAFNSIPPMINVEMPLKMEAMLADAMRNAVAATSDAARRQFAFVKKQKREIARHERNSLNKLSGAIGLPTGRYIDSDDEEVGETAPPPPTTRGFVDTNVIFRHCGEETTDQMHRLLTAATQSFMSVVTESESAMYDAMPRIEIDRLRAETTSSSSNNVDCYDSINWNDKLAIAFVASLRNRQYRFDQFESRDILPCSLLVPIGLYRDELQCAPSPARHRSSGGGSLRDNDASCDVQRSLASLAYMSPKNVVVVMCEPRRLVDADLRTANGREHWRTDGGPSEYSQPYQRALASTPPVRLYHVPLAAFRGIEDAFLPSNIAGLLRNFLFEDAALRIVMQDEHLNSQRESEQWKKAERAKTHARALRNEALAEVGFDVPPLSPRRPSSASAPFPLQVGRNTYDAIDGGDADWYQSLLAHSPMNEQTIAHAANLEAERVLVACYGPGYKSVLEQQAECQTRNRLLTAYCRSWRKERIDQWTAAKQERDQQKSKKKEKEETEEERRKAASEI